MDEFFYTVEQKAVSEFKVRGSRFIAYIFQIRSAEDFKKELQALKKEHPKAVHHCFAYRLGTDGNNFRSSDDGEPSGTAGKPILGQIDSRQLTNVCIIVVRYFGGTLLGVPGLIQAYKSAAALVIQIVPIVQKAILKNYILHFDYTSLNDVMTILKHYPCEIYSQDLQLFCSLSVGIPLSRHTEVMHKLEDLPRVEIKAEEANV